MSFLQVQQISLELGARVLLDKVQFSLDPGQHLALVGSNGCGKSTLMKILAGINKADSGTLVKRKAVRVNYLPQGGIQFSRSLLKDELETAFAHLNGLLEELENIQEALGTEKDEAQLMNLVHKQHEIQEFLGLSEYNQRSKLIGLVAAGLGFSQEDLDKPCDTFSGGWQMRIALAKILLEKPEVMLLDEPTNYLDLQTRWWLRDFIKSSDSAILLVSHDRSFLDQTISGIIELHKSKAKLYPGNYTNYEAKRSLEMDQLLQAWKKQQQEILHMERFVERFRSKATKAVQAQSRIKALEKIERIEIPEALKKVEFSFPPAPPSSKIVLELEEISRSYPGKKVLEKVSFTLERGQKLALVGRNGAGKSTLMRVLAQVDQPDKGNLRYGGHVEASWFSQDSEERLNLQNTVFTELEESCPSMTELDLRKILGSFLFSGDDIDKPISILSGGEKSRVSLAKILLAKSNLLLLDEPTNHLDMNSKDVLIKALKNYEGTLVFVSHDQDFIQALADRILEILPGPEASSCTWFEGDWDYYIWKKGADDLSVKESEKLIHGLQNAAEKPVAPRMEKESKLSYEEEKRKKSELRKLENRELELVQKLEDLEARKAFLNQEMGTPEVYLSQESMKVHQEELKRLDQQIQEVSENWEQCSKELEELKVLFGGTC